MLARLRGLNRTAVAGAIVTVLTCGCSSPEGSGEVRSDKLFVDECWDGKFDLEPTFFAANPYKDSMLIRIQRGDDIEEVSDGIIVLVNQVAGIRSGKIGRPIAVGLPPGVSPPGVPLKEGQEPVDVSIALYLHDSCHLQNRTLYSLDGTITFESLFSNDPNESDADDRFTRAQFEASFADPRDVLSDGSYPPGRVSTVTGWFEFFFQRGQPAQPFP